MATRFYFPSSGTPPISPTEDAAWDEPHADLTGTVQVFPCYTSKQNTTRTALTRFYIDDGQIYILFAQYISPSLAAQTIAAQTVTLVMQGYESLVDANQFMTLCIRAVAADGVTVRGTILALASGIDNTELTTTYTNRTFSATTSSLAVSAGDRLVIEVGTSGNPGAAGDHATMGLYVGDESAVSDLTSADTGTTFGDPWLEFANTLTFTSSGIAVISGHYARQGMR